MESTEEKELYYYKGIEKVLDTLFMDISFISSEEKDLFFELFYNREAKFESLISKLKEASLNKENFLITGNSGVGKTSFIKKFILDEKLHKKLEIVPILIDYRNTMPNKWQNCLIEFIQNSKNIFKNIEEIHNLIENTIENIDFNIKKIYEHIRYLKIKKSIHFVLFLDDFDHAENDWFHLLDYFMPFARPDAPTSIVLSIRPPLLAEIETYDTRYSFHFSRNTNKFHIDPLETREVLAARLAPILIVKSQESFLNYLITLFRKRTQIEKKLIQILKILNIKSLKDLKTFEYPLTEAHNNFMRSITNGDYREIFAIAMDSICYVLKNYNELESRIEYGYLRKVIGHEKTLEIFYNNNGDSHYKIININTQKSKSDNSLYYNTLEAVKLFKVIDEEKFFSTLQTFGHDITKVKNALLFLQTKEMRMIEPIKIYSPGKRELRGELEEYQITEKGDYYLRMAKWEEYKKLCGEYGRSLIEEVLI